jgi:hypothetical protein
MEPESMPPTEAAILERIIEPHKPAITPDLARMILQWEFPPDDRQHIHELLEKAKAGPLTPEEQAEAQNYERIGHLLSVLKAKARASLEAASQAAAEVPPGILRSQQAFWKDLPELLKNKRNRGKWVCYHGDERVGIGDHKALIRETLQRRIPEDAYYIDRIQWQELAPWEDIEVEPLYPRVDEDDLPPEA